MPPPNETLTTWNNLAALYEATFMDLDLYNASYDLICSPELKPRARVLEIGCGPGNITRYLLAKRPDYEILGIDVAPNMIERAQTNNPEARFRVMDARAINQLDEQYDLVVSGFCLPYLSAEAATTLIADAGRLLNPGGLFYLSFVEGDAAQSGYKTGPGGRVYFHYHLLQEVLDALQAAGFGDSLTLKVPYPGKEAEPEEHTILIARKANTA